MRDPDVSEGIIALIFRVVGHCCWTTWYWRCRHCDFRNIETNSWQM